jgi:hypothetical protein
MLTPISYHHAKSENVHGDHKRKKSTERIATAKQEPHECQLATNFANSCVECTYRPSPLQKVEREFNTREEVKPSKVDCKACTAVTLVTQGGGQVPRPIAFHVVVLDVMVKVRVPRVTQKRAENIVHDMVQHTILLLEDTLVVGMIVQDVGERSQ